MNEPDIERLKQVPIVDIVAAAGLTIVGHSPVLSTKEHDSLRLWVKTNSWFWYSVGVGGSVIDFVMHTQRVDFNRACEILASHAALNPPVFKPVFAPPPPQPLPQDLHIKLHNSMTAENVAYWNERGLYAPAQSHFFLGAYRHALYGQTYTVPVVEDGKLVNIRLRLLNPENPKDKYRPYDVGRGTHLYNGDILTPDLHGVVIVAGELKVDGLWQANIPAVSPTAGCGHWRPEWTARLQYCRKIYIAFDPGEEIAAERIAREIGPRALVVECNAKPDDYLLTHSALDFRALLRRSYSVLQPRLSSVAVSNALADALNAAPAVVMPAENNNVPWRKQLWENHH